MFNNWDEENDVYENLEEETDVDDGTTDMGTTTSDKVIGICFFILAIIMGCIRLAIETIKTIFPYLIIVGIVLSFLFGIYFLITKKKYSVLGCIISFCVLLAILNALSM